MKKTLTFNQLKKLVRESSDEKIPIDEYLKSENGKAALALWKKKVDELGAKPAKEAGFLYAVANELYVALTEDTLYLEVSSDLLEESPESVVSGFDMWLTSDYCADILTQDDDKRNVEILSAFGEEEEEY